MDTATTNVPGPAAAGPRRSAAGCSSPIPFVPIVGTIRIVVAIFSYDGGLYFGVTGDRDHAPDIGVLTAGIEAGLGELLGRAAAVPALTGAAADQPRASSSASLTPLSRTPSKCRRWMGTAQSASSMTGRSPTVSAIAWTISQ